jgi:AhpD family alkylhydroperoxidase
MSEKTEKQLRKENAELKELKKKKEEIEIMTNFCKTCKKMHTDQLTKAKEIIKRLKCLIEDVCDINYLSKNNTKLLIRII